MKIIIVRPDGSTTIVGPMEALIAVSLTPGDAENMKRMFEVSSAEEPDIYCAWDPKLFSEEKVNHVIELAKKV